MVDYTFASVVQAKTPHLSYQKHSYLGTGLSNLAVPSLKIGVHRPTVRVQLWM